jgi:hypothetical protein
MNSLSPLSPVSPLWQYPERAAINRPIPKARFYAQASLRRSRQDVFAQQVERIEWAYKLAPETINLPASFEVPEIQIFALWQKKPQLSEDILRVMDATVKFPVLFECHYGKEIRLQACYKRPAKTGDADGQWVLSDYHTTGWQAENAPRQALPVATHLLALYSRLLHPLMPALQRDGESMEDWIGRLEQISRKAREADKATRQLKHERQFNHKVEINLRLQQLTHELEQLRA